MHNFTGVKGINGILTNLDTEKQNLNLTGMWNQNSQNHYNLSKFGKLSSVLTNSNQLLHYFEHEKIY